MALSIRPEFSVERQWRSPASRKIEVRETDLEPSSRVAVRKIVKHRGVEYVRVDGLWYLTRIDPVRDVYYVLLGEGREMWTECP